MSEAKSAGAMLEVLACRTHSIVFDDLGEAGAALIEVALIDTLGVALAGADTEPVRILREAARETAGGGHSLVLGSRRRTNALDAGLINAAAAHALDYDDGTSVMGGHPSTLLIPAVLALGEETQASGREVMAAYSAGYEIIIRFSRGLNPRHYGLGWHPTSTIGVFGVAAAAARLLKLDSERTAMSLALAASMASGIKANFGTMAKSLHIGRAVRDGIHCAKLAARGFTANPAAAEAKQGFFNVYNGPGEHDLEAVVAGLEGPLAVDQERNSVKAYACCASTHASIDAALDIRRRHDPTPDDIVTIDIQLDPLRIPHTDRTTLPEPLSGKFSQQYLVARALSSGGIRLEHFEGKAHVDPATLALMSKVALRPVLGGAQQNSFAATVTVHMASGEQYEATADVRAERPTGKEYLSSAAFWSKFHDCSGRALGPNAAVQLGEALRNVRYYADVRELTMLLEMSESSTTGQAMSGAA